MTFPVTYLTQEWLSQPGVASFTKGLGVSQASIFVAVWKFLVPFPRALDNCLQ
jgi:hypothetical protein